MTTKDNNNKIILEIARKDTHENNKTDGRHLIKNRRHKTINIFKKLKGKKPVNLEFYIRQKYLSKIK